MSDWWNSLGLLKQIFYFIAVPATVVLIVQSVLVVMGLGDSDVGMESAEGIDEPVELDFDEDLDGDAEGFSGDFRFFTIRGLIAFFAVLGWTGAAMTGTMNTFIVVVASLTAGLLAMGLIGYLFYGMTKLQSSGNIQYANCVGKTGEVYLTIPGVGGGKGKVMVTVQERLIEAAAVTKQPDAIRSGETIHVVGVMSDHTLIVKRGDKQ